MRRRISGSVLISADLVFMADAVRVAVHLGRELDDPIFFNVAGDGKKVTHVAKLRTETDFSAIRRSQRVAG